MAGLTAGGAPVYRDSAGVLRDMPETATPDSPAAMLPAGEFSGAQADLSTISLPFRKLLRDAFKCTVSTIATNTPIDRASVEAKKCTSFHVVNPNMCYVRLRGAANANDKIAEGEGWLWPPGFVGVYSTQYPDFVSVIAVERPGFPLAGMTFTPIELAYGIGGG